MSADLSQLKETDACSQANCSDERAGHIRSFCLSPNKLIFAAKKLDELGYFLEDVSCVHVKEGFELVYHFDHWDNPGRIVLRTIISEDKKEADSIARIFPGADWHERECYDFFGIRFKGHSNLIPLLLPPEIDNPPLLKKEKEKKDLKQLLPDPENVLTSPQDEEFMEYILQCSKSKSKEE
ncbi:NADH-quinone oxidoreductase subunit C [Desulfohalobiaceae bacterium Ax17]|uniref:NADH-quinone oxidoreductase subunit C n=1 Tax=Desulfovulcanus ferrireducens TaxID=2831190 RepID=UPI00207BB81F|nr:NADH-quinone oxidoreductase subunit C [Desulfovulcanus ferrireducens]MBT8763668.1 NADH-quinone oxidoreductase subunit C [Desulfovulcanus ferrireducens]